MGLLNNILTRQILFAVVTFYGFPVFWWSYNDMDDDDRSSNYDEDDGYYLSVKFLMSTGFLMTSMGMTYVMMPFDLVPDFIPIFGRLDDMIAKLVAGGGMMMMYMGYQFGTGETPKEFEICVIVVSTVYGIVVPILMGTIVPLIAPAIKAISVPMKAFAGVVLGMVKDKANDPTVQSTVIDMANKAASEL